MAGSMVGREEAQREFQAERKSILKALAVICSAVVALIVIAGVAIGSNRDESIGLIGFALLIAAAAFSVGGLLGFLFGVPRDGGGTREKPPIPGSTPTAPMSASDRSTSVSATFAWNSNLVEVSDWLTKILVGVGLTQLLNIPTALRELGAWLAKGFVGTLPKSPIQNIGEVAAAVAASIVVFFVCMGFIIGHLVTQLWLFRAYSLARRDSEEIGKNGEFVLGVGVPNTQSGPGASATPPGSSVIQAANEVLSQPEASLATAAQHAAYGVAAAIKGDYETAVRQLRTAVARDRSNPKYLLELGRALFGAQNYSESLLVLEEAYPLSVKEGEPIEVVKPLMLAGLYLDKPAGFEKVITYGERFARMANDPDRALINRYLACAYGQKYKHNRDVSELKEDSKEQRDLRKQAKEAIERDLNAQIGEARNRERSYLNSLMHPASGSSEDDLACFASFPEFKELLGNQ